MITVKIAEAGKPTLNNRTYSAETWQQSIKHMGGQPVWGTIQVFDGLTVPIEHISHTIANLRMDGNDVIGDVTVLDTPHGAILAKLIASGMNVQYRPCGYGDVDKQGNVTNYALHYIAAVVEAD